MNAVNRILKHQFPTMGGLNDVLLGSKLQFPISREGFCQIIHENGDHWITISNVFCGTDEVDLYDSLGKTASSNAWHVCKRPLFCAHRVRQLK